MIFAHLKVTPDKKFPIQSMNLLLSINKFKNLYALNRKIVFKNYFLISINNSLTKSQFLLQQPTPYNAFQTGYTITCIAFVRQTLVGATARQP